MWGKFKKNGENTDTLSWENRLSYVQALEVTKVHPVSVWNNYVQWIKNGTRITDLQGCSWSWSKIDMYMPGAIPLEPCLVNF